MLNVRTGDGSGVTADQTATPDDYPRAVVEFEAKSLRT
jgi:hypothetical protein